MKIGDYRDDIATDKVFIEKLMQQILITTNFAIIFKATKEMVREMLVTTKEVQLKTIEFHNLLSFFKRYKLFRMPNIGNKVMDFRQFHMFRL